VKQSRELAAATLQPGDPAGAPALIEIPRESEFVLPKMEVLGYPMQYSIFGCGPAAWRRRTSIKRWPNFSSTSLDHQFWERQHPGQSWDAPKR
jgi:hypothetical protein